jgi:predicted ATP-dependent serine protease
MVIALEIGAVKRVVAQYEPNILVIDTTDELQVDRFDGDIQKQNIIIDTLKGIAQRNNTLIFAIHHLNKASASQGTVGLHSLKGSSNVVQKADKVIVLKGNRHDNHRTVISEKSRDDGRLELITYFEPKTMTFRRLEEGQV